VSWIINSLCSRYVAIARLDVIPGLIHSEPVQWRAGLSFYIIEQETAQRKRMSSFDANLDDLQTNTTFSLSVLDQPSSNALSTGKQISKIKPMPRKKQKKQKKTPLSTLQERLMIKAKKKHGIVMRQVDMLQAQLHYLRVINGPFTNSIADFTNHCCGIMNEYIHLFPNGIVPRTRPNYNRQLAFVHTVMDPNVLFCGMRGTESFIDQHRSYSAVFRRRSIKSEGITVVCGPDDTIVKLSCTISLTISRESLSSLYPHILQNEVLVQQIMGLDLHLPSYIYFYFDDAGRVFRVDGECDLVRAWSGLVSNIDTVEEIVNKSQLHSDGVIRH